MTISTSSSTRAILRLSDVCARVGLSRSTVYQFISTGHFPPPIKLGKRASGWLSDEIDGWLLQRKLARVGT